MKPTFLFLLAVLASNVAPAAEPMAKRLNILFFTADDMNYDSSGVCGGPIKDLTPNIDRLAAEGLRFEFAYSTVAVCQPVRQIIQTGTYPHRNGSMGFHPIKPDARTLNEQLHDAGYLISMFGKGPHHQPKERFCVDVANDKISRHPAKLAEATRTFLRQAREQGRPFFHNVNCYDPHRPFIGMRGTNDLAQGEPPSRWIKPEEVTDVPGFLEDLPEVRRELAGYYTNVRRLDDALGAVLQVLEEEGLADNTLVMLYAGDHGMSFPFAKSNDYENSSRGALFIRWPGVTRPGSVDTHHLVSTLDFAPTLLEAARLPPLHGIDGRSFLPAVKGQRMDGWDRVFTFYNAAFGNNWLPMRCVRTKDRAYLWNAWSDGTREYHTENMAGLTWRAMLAAGATNPAIQARTEFYLHRVPEEFYDLTHDPSERVNLISDPTRQTEIEAMRQELLALMRRTGDPFSEAFANRQDRALAAAVLTKLKAEYARVPKPRNDASNSNRDGDWLSPDAFAKPPVQTRPGCFWAWLNGSITAEQITRDLEAMKQGGMRGGEIWDVAAHADPDRRVPAGPPFLGPESTRLIAHAIREGDRLGLELGVVASSGWNAGGSWIKPEHAGKGLYHSITTVKGPGDFHDALPLPELPKHCPRDEQGRPCYLREVAVLAVPDHPDRTVASASQVIDLTTKVGADGRLRWAVPAGDWAILRFVCLNHGQQLIVPSPNSGGPMIDFFDPHATEFHLRHIAGTILKELGRDSFEGTCFKTMEFDSMELDGFTPWTETMAGEFERQAGYPVIGWLPFLAGWTLADPEAQERFLYDWKKFVSDRLIESHYATARRVLQSYGVKLIAESGGPGPPIWNSNPVDAIKALGAVDIPRGEFWIRHRGIFLVKAIAAAAHVYDKRLVDAEAFTTWRRWVDGPLNHKALADRALCEGLNCFSGHTFASSPPEAGFPGWAYHAGTDINPRATWWPMVRGFMDYLARCSYMLRQGWAVADVCYYYGDQAPNFFPPLCNVPDKPQLEGLDPRNDFDVCSSEVILERMRVEKGRIMLPDGMSYGALVLPEQDHIPPEVIQKLCSLVADGATVIGHQRPSRAPGLQRSETENHQVEQLGKALWGADVPNGQSVQVRHVGRGRLVIAKDRTKALREIGIGADFEIAGRVEPDLGPLDFVHRKTAGDEFYFIRNKTREQQTLTCRFRVAAEANGQTPEFWWPDSGRRSVCHGWKAVAGGYTELPVPLGPLGSVFVVFRKGGGGNDLDPLARDTFLAAAEPASVTLDGPWKVEFPEGWGAPRTTTFEKLQSWTESADEGIRFFSGIATYRKSFELSASLAAQDRLFLELGDLAEIADVRLNGKPLGLAWLPPCRIEISGRARAGANQLEIRVANLWANRLNADSLLPETRRFTRSNLDRIQTDPTSDSGYGRIPRGPTRPVYTRIPPLMKSGLFGPVRVIAPAAAVPGLKPGAAALIGP